MQPIASSLAFKDFTLSISEHGLVMRGLLVNIVRVYRNIAPESIASQINLGFDPSMAPSPNAPHTCTLDPAITHSHISYGIRCGSSASKKTLYMSGCM